MENFTAGIGNEGWCTIKNGVIQGLTFADGLVDMAYYTNFLDNSPKARLLEEDDATRQASLDCIENPWNPAGAEGLFQCSAGYFLAGFLFRPCQKEKVTYDQCIHKVRCCK